MPDRTFAARVSGGLGDESRTLDSRLEADIWDNLGCFGWLRGVRDRAPMLELKKKTGNILAVGYAWLERAEFDPSEGITLHLAGQRVRIIGRNLNVDTRPLVRLFEGITRHRVPWVREATQADVLTAQADSCLVETISWER
jgi:hypothetical protein